MQPAASLHHEPIGNTLIHAAWYADTAIAPLVHGLGTPRTRTRPFAQRDTRNSPLPFIASLLGPKMTAWEHFERLVAAVHKAADAGAAVKWNDKINGRQFDVSIRFRRGLYDHLTVVECKDYETPVPVEKVEAFVTKSRDAQANVAVLASSSGFQSGARDVALRHNITLLHVAASEDVNPAIFGVQFGDLTEIQHIADVTLEYTNGYKIHLPTQGNVLTYYAKHTTLCRLDKEVTLDSVVDEWRIAKGQKVPDGEYIIPLPDGTVVTGPQDGVVLLEPLRAVRLVTSVVMGRPLVGPVAIDPAVMLPDVNVKNVSTGEERAFKYSELALGLDTSFEAGKFYEAPGLGYFYFCEQVENGMAHICMVESFQMGQLVQARLTLEAKYGKHYISVTDKSTIERLQRRLERLHDNGSGVRL
jgi:hypothetical protein